MRRERTIWGACALFLAVTWLSGCKPTPPPAVESEPATPEAAPATPAAEAGAPAEAAPAATTTPVETSTEAAPAPSTQVALTAGADSTAAAPATSANQKVALPSSELLAGIPGEGDLTAEQIKAWLDDPKNHVPLEFQLPLGLSVGQSQLNIPTTTRAMVELGRQLYFDTRLSSDNTISCASCHDPAEGFAKHTQFGIGVNGQQGGRNSPVSYNRILSTLQFWDGRADSLEAQAVGPIANPIEMANTHDQCVSMLSGIEGYRVQFEKVFGSMNIDAVGKALAAFERTLVSGPSPYDYGEELRKFADADLDDLKENDPDLYAEYEKAKAAAEAHPMSESAQRGRDIYFSEKGNCSACHVGPNLTDEKYYNLGVGMDAEKPDLGRYEVTKDEADKGAFKTPTVRNVALSAPYMHDGSHETLEEVVDWYVKGGLANPHLSSRMKKLELNDQDKKDLVEFMKACTGEFPQIATGRLPK